MLKQMESFFKENPDQYKEFLKIQNQIQSKQVESQKQNMTPKEKMDSARKLLLTQRTSKHSQAITESRKNVKDAEEKSKQDAIRELSIKKLEVKKAKLQRKYAKQKQKKLNVSIQNEFELVDDI